MAFDDTTLASIESAITDLATGSRKVKVVISGNSVEYGLAQLGELRALRTEIAAEINAAAGGNRVTIVTSSKGL